jgi:hypothetical protein
MKVSRAIVPDTLHVLLVCAATLEAKVIGAAVSQWQSGAPSAHRHVRPMPRAARGAGLARGDLLLPDNTMQNNSCAITTYMCNTIPSILSHLIVASQLVCESMVAHG